MSELRPRPLGPDESLFFLHIPKTAGSTLRQLLKERFDRDEVCPVWKADDFLALPPEARTRYRLYQGHFNYNLIDLLPRKPVTLTVLREPIARYLSYLRHVQRDSRHYAHSSLQALGLREYIRQSIDGNNIQVRMLAAQEEDSLMFSERPLSEADLERAKARLESLACFGLQERFSESLDQFAWVLGWHPFENNRMVNVSPRSGAGSDLDDDMMRLIREHNRYDLELYAYAVSLFEARQQQLAGKTAWERYGESLPEDAYSRSFQVNLRRPMPGSGWYPYEPAHALRWTGPGTRSSLCLPVLKGESVQVTFQVKMAITQEIERSLGLEVNGVQVRLKRKKHPNSLRTYQALVPADVLSRAPTLTEFVISTAETVSPKALGKNDDERKLGVAVTSFEVGPVPARRPLWRRF